MTSSIRVGSFTPWGSADFVESLAPGITSVATSSHGGIHLDPMRNAMVALVWRNPNGWYEEDCEASIVLVTFPDVAPEVSREKLHDSLAWAFTEQHAAVFPEQAKAREGRPTFDSVMAELQAKAKQSS